jgi:hypothetical protein
MAEPSPSGSLTSGSYLQPALVGELPPQGLDPAQRFLGCRDLRRSEILAVQVVVGLLAELDGVLERLGDQPEVLGRQQYLRVAS